MGWVTRECVQTAKEVHDESAYVEIFDNSHDTKHEVHMDASAKALGAVLLQKRATEASFHPIVYFSKKLNNA